MSIFAPTIPQAFAATVAARSDLVAIRSHTTGAELTWAQYADQACRVAASMAALGLQRGDRVALMMRNRPEFHPVDMGVLLAGGTAFSVYNSSAPEQLRYLLGHAAAKVVVVEEGFLDRVEAVRAALPALQHVLTVERDLPQLLGADPVDLESAAAVAEPTDLATLIYTSGTTGDPKGVMLNHVNLMGGIEGYAAVLGRQITDWRTISALPLAHIAERNATHYFAACMGSHVTTCDDITKLGPVIAAVHPQWFFATPRFWEKYQSVIESGLAADPAAAAAWADARTVGRRVFQLEQAGAPVSPDVSAEWKSVRENVILPRITPLGLDALEVANSGAAPMPLHTARFFLEIGIPLSDVYGQSEGAGTITWDPHDIVPGTSGKSLPGMEMRFAEDNEIQLRGPCIFSGYLDDPVRTAEAFTADGWFVTGDIGEVDERGNLRIIDRKKELIVPSSGHNVAPALIEAALKEHPLVGTACAVGDGRPNIAALLVLDPEAAPVWAKAHDLPTDLGALAKEPALLAEIERGVEAANARFNQPEQVRSWTVIGDVWLPDTDLLTPTAKLKRRGIHARYAAEIEALYS